MSAEVRVGGNVRHMVGAAGSWPISDASFNQYINESVNQTLNGYIYSFNVPGTY